MKVLLLDQAILGELATRFIKIVLYIVVITMSTHGFSSFVKDNKSLQFRHIHNLIPQSKQLCCFV